MIKKILDYVNNYIAKGLGYDRKHPENRVANAYIYGEDEIISRNNHITIRNSFDKIMSFLLGEK